MDTSTTALLIFASSLFFIEKGGAHDHAVDITSDIGYTCVVYKDDKPACTGTLISRMWVLTTGLCVREVPNSRIFIRIGDPSKKGQNKHKYYKAEKSEVHPECIGSNNMYNPKHDIALLMLNEPFFDSKYVYIAKIPHQLEYWTPDSNVPLDVASWKDFLDSAKTLKEATWHGQSQLLPPKTCREKIRVKNYKLGKCTCATYHHTGGSQNCMTDVGAPLTFDYMLVGILSYKEGCGADKGAASFVNIPMHSEWIREITHKYTAWISL